MVSVGHAALGTEFVVASATGPRRATVVERPFYDPKKPIKEFLIVVAPGGKCLPWMLHVTLQDQKSAQDMTGGAGKETATFLGRYIARLSTCSSCGQRSGMHTAPHGEQSPPQEGQSVGCADRSCACVVPSVRKPSQPAMINSAPRSPIKTQVAIVAQVTIRGMIEPSTIRSPSMPFILRSAPTTAASSRPMRAVPT
jgi:hypothetical protein